jgi:glycosyltransferase involved in cell wall biosynthesis
LNHDLPLKGVRLARVSTVVFFVDTQLHNQIHHVIGAGAEVTVIASEASLNRLINYCNYVSVEIPRNISLVKDVVALFNLLRVFRDNEFQIVHSTTPKAGLLCAVAGKFAGVPVRLHTFTGQPWVTLKGTKRFLAKLADKVIGLLNSHCYTDGNSQKQFLIDQRIVNGTKLSVLGVGSIAGVDTSRFSVSRFSEDNRKLFKTELCIPLDAKVLLFVGRIVVDKGVVELVRAFEEIINQIPNVYLLMVGPQELTESQLGIGEKTNLKNKIVFTGYTDVPEKYMSISDLLCIPSYREGFGTVVIEAAAMKLPTVGSNIYGLSDSIVDGNTGLLVEVKHIGKLRDALLYLLQNDSVRKKMGLAAQSRANRQFSNTVVNQLLVEEYISLLNK